MPCMRRPGLAESGLELYHEATLSSSGQDWGLPSVPPAEI